MTSEYWDRFWRNRASRRRFLATGTTMGVGAAGLALVGCGNDDDDDDTPAPTPTTAPSNGDPTPTPDPGDDDDMAARYGGTVRYPLEGVSSGDPPTLFPFENLTYLAQHPATLHYSRLLTEIAGPGISPSDYTALEGDVAEGLPEQTDEVTYIFKMRPNVHFHDKAPMNGRQATAQDFQETYEAFLSLPSQNAPVYEAVVDRVEATDDMTLRITLREPFAPFLTIHASTPEGVWFIPVDIIDSGQVQTDPVGTGPWMFDSWNSGVSMTWNRNPNYFIPELPYFDRVEGSLVNDPQRIIAGLRAGELDFSGLDGPRYDQAQAELDPNGHEFTFGVGSFGAFYFNFDIEDGRWRDTRLRQALSMSWDRHAVLSVLDGTGQGNWYSPFCATNLAPYYLSPRDEDYGDNAKYFEHNREEARQLMEAVTGTTSPRIRLTANVDRYGAGAQQLWELLAGELRSTGWEVELVFQEYGAYIQSTYLGDIPEGVGVGPLIGSPRDPNDILSRNLASTSARHNWGGQPIEEMDRIDELIDQQRTILDLEERIAFIHDMQREMAEYLLVVPYTAAAGYAYANPWVQNWYWKNSYSVHLSTMTQSYFTPERIAQG
jgi:peptide/nickel transport system substrate-binding protein